MARTSFGTGGSSSTTEKPTTCRIWTGLLCVVWKPDNPVRFVAGDWPVENAIGVDRPVDRGSSFSGGNANGLSSMARTDRIRFVARPRVSHEVRSRSGVDCHDTCATRSADRKAPVLGL